MSVGLSNKRNGAVTILCYFRLVFGNRMDITRNRVQSNTPFQPTMFIYNYNQACTASWKLGNNYNTSRHSIIITIISNTFACGF